MIMQRTNISYPPQGTNQGSHGTLLRRALGVGVDQQDLPAISSPSLLAATTNLLVGVPAPLPATLMSSAQGGGGDNNAALAQWHRDAAIIGEIRRLQLETAGRNAALLAARESAVLREVALAQQGAWGRYGVCGFGPQVPLSSAYGVPLLRAAAAGQGQLSSPLSIQELQIQASKSLAARLLLQRSREMLSSGDRHHHEHTHAATSAESETVDKAEDSHEDYDDMDKSRGGTVPSERVNLSLPENCETPAEALKVLTALGRTLRSKSDPFIDASRITVDPKYTPTLPRRGANEIFPEKLYKMLREVEDRGLTDVVSFMGHGRAFRVHKVDRFVQELMPEYFPSLGKWSSFSRQCNLWGFLRCTDGENPDCNAYYHELFLRGHCNILRFMRRVGVPHGKDRRKYRLPEGNDPNFYSMTSMPDFEDRQLAEADSAGK